MPEFADANDKEMDDEFDTDIEDDQQLQTNIFAWLICI